MSEMEQRGYSIQENAPLKDNQLELARGIQRNLCTIESPLNGPYKEHDRISLPPPIGQTISYELFRKYAVGMLHEQPTRTEQPTPLPEPRVIDEPLPYEYDVQPIHRIPRTQHGRLGTFNPNIYMKLLQEEQQ
jgi:hypothetical protein